MDNFLKSSIDYINGDKFEISQINQIATTPESPTRDELELEMTEIQEERRGITYDNKGKLIFNCNVFSIYCQTRVFAFRKNDSWYLYNYKIGIYECVSDSFAKKVFKTIFDEPKTNVWKPSYENQYMSALTSDVKVYSEIPVNPLRLCFKNGIVDLEQGTITEHTSKEIHTMLIPHDYVPTDDCPNFKAFISEIMEEDTEKVNLLQEIIGYCLYRDIKIHKLFIFLGNGSNGKSLLCNILATVFDRSNISSVFLENLGERFSMQNMDNKLVNISSEGDGAKLKNSSILKSILAGDFTEVEKKFKDSYTTKITSKFILCTNNMFTSTDTSDGFYRRLLIIPFNRKYIEIPKNYEKEEGKFYIDVNLENELLKESQGIINWAVEGFQRLYDNDFQLSYSSVCDKALKNYVASNDYIYSFIQECLQISTGSRVKRSDIYKEFVLYLSRNGFKGVSLTAGQFLPKLKQSLKTHYNFDFRTIKNKEYYVLDLKLK